MRKFFALSMLLMLAMGGFACARTQYDSTGRNIIYDGTIRGQRRAAQARAEQNRKMQAAAAARLNYEEALKTLEEPKPKTNFYQDRIKK